MTLMSLHFSVSHNVCSCLYKRFLNINIMSRNIYDVCRFNFLVVKVFGFNFITVEFGTLNMGQTKTTIYDYILFFASSILSIFTRYYMSEVTLNDASESAILEAGMNLLVSVSLYSMIFLKCLNFTIREKYGKIITNINWIDVQVIIVQ